MKVFQKRWFILLVALVLVSISSSISTSVFAQTKLNKKEILADEMAARIDSQRVDAAENDNPAISDEAKRKIRVLRQRGYARIASFDSSYDSGIFALVYPNQKAPKEFRSAAYNDDGIYYSLRYAGAWDEPNLYAYVTFTDNNVQYLFLKINYRLEYEIIENWQRADDSVFTRKVFY